MTMRGRPHSPAVGALVREAMRSRWGSERTRAAVRFEQSRGADARSRRDDALGPSHSH